MNPLDAEKKHAGIAALRYVEQGMVVGVGTGSTVHYFIEALAKSAIAIKGAVPSSLKTETLLKAARIPLVDPNHEYIDVYVDGADECNPLKQLIKGGGGALTREKILAAQAKQFVCIVDHSKAVQSLGQFPLPVEVHPMAKSFVARELFKMGGKPSLRVGFTTDNGNLVLDVEGLCLNEPIHMEESISLITGVICCGLFAKRAADIVIVASGETLKIA